MNSFLGSIAVEESGEVAWDEDSEEQRKAFYALGEFLVYSVWSLIIISLAHPLSENSSLPCLDPFLNRDKVPQPLHPFLLNSPIVVTCVLFAHFL